MIFYNYNHESIAKAEPTPWICGHESIESETCKKYGENNGIMWRISGIKLFLDLHYAGGIFDFGNPEVTCNTFGTTTKKRNVLYPMSH